MSKPSKLHTYFDENSGENIMEKKVKHVLRGINKQGQFGEDGSVPAEVVEEYLSTFLSDGYKLAYMNMLGQDPNMLQMIYVLVKE